MPEVSIIVPCYNEERTIQLLLEAILHQTYPARQMEVIISDAMSSDQTRARILSFHADHPELAVEIVDNPRCTIPSALNEALKAARGETIVRLDAHCVPRPDYVERCVNALKAGAGENVGGVWDIKPGAPDWIGRAIAVAAAHPLGVGDAQYRHTQRAQSVDTVPFGSFRRDLLQRIGFYDEDLLANEDYEWNARLRQIGGKVWLDPAICSTYFARPNLGALMRQYWRYGFLESAHAAPLSGHAALAAGLAAGFCARAARIGRLEPLFSMGGSPAYRISWNLFDHSAYCRNSNCPAAERPRLDLGRPDRHRGDASFVGQCFPLVIIERSSSTPAVTAKPPGCSD